MNANLNMTHAMKRYLFWFANEHLDFRLNEIKSIAALFKVHLNWLEMPKENPFWIVEVDSDESVCKIASRSVTLRYIVDLWAMENTVQELHNQLRELPDAVIQPCRHSSFKIKVEMFGSSQTQQEKINKIESFHYLPLDGPVSLKNPKLALEYIEYFGLDSTNIPGEPYKVYFGRVVCEGQRDLISKHSLKKRKFIGNTSLDPQLSLIMANQALVQEGDLILDPFVGSGSLLIAAAEFGGHVLGTDIDFLMLHGKSRPTRKQDRDKPRKDESVYRNLTEYGLGDRYIDIVVADFSLPLWRPATVFDAIITDPPYGMRESMERIGSQRGVQKISEEHLCTHIPSKVSYCLGQLLTDLLNFSLLHLKTNGHLVTWLPIIRSEYDEKKLPKHDCLELIGNSEQILSTTSSRRLLTYRKIKNSQNSETFVNENEDTFRQRYFKHVEQLRKAKSNNTN